MLLLYLHKNFVSSPPKGYFCRALTTGGQGPVTGGGAEVLGISQTVYFRYERGFQTIPVIHLLKLADYYKVSTANHKRHDVK